MNTDALSPAEIEAYWANGYALVENALTREQLDALVRDFAAWHDGVYTGTVSPEVEAAHAGNAVPIHGPAGTACLMHTRLLHGSAPNNSDRPRTLFISEYRAEDSRPLQVNHIPSRYDGEVVRGVRTNRVRCSAYEMEFPEVPEGASFFSQQARTGGAAM